MKTITLVNSENALRILNECSLTSESDNISVTNGDVVSLIFNSKQYNKENFGHTLRIGFDGGGIVGCRNAYIEIDLYKFDDIIEIELIELNYGIALTINSEIVYYKIRYQTFEEIINLTNLRALDLSGWPELDSLEPIKHLDKIESFKLGLGSENEKGEIEQAQFKCESINFFPNLRCLDLRINSFANLNTLSSLINLELFSIEFIDGWGDEKTYIENPIDLDFIKGMIKLKRLETYKLRRISDISFLNYLPNLEDLKLCSPYAVREINLNKTLFNLTRIELEVPINLESLDFISFTPNLQFLIVNSNELIKSIEKISQLNQLRHLNLDHLTSINSYQSISNCLLIESLSIESCPLKYIDIDFSRLNKLKHLNLSYSKITNLGNIKAAKNLFRLDISACEKLVQLSSIEKLLNLNEVRASFSTNIREIDRLSTCLNLRILDIDDAVTAIQILMASAFLRQDEKYIQENIFRWIDKIDLSRYSSLFTSRLLNCINLCKVEIKYAIRQTCLAMRSRGLQSEALNDLDANTWETWCNLVLELEKEDAISSLIVAVNELDIVRETEVILGPVIMTTSKIIEKYPEEKENLLNWVNEQLHLLEGHTEEQRQIAPSAAVIFASANRKEEVLFWLHKATDEKAPLWRERVLKALVKHYAEQENFSDARRLLKEMQIQNEIDMAIASLALAMSIKYPIDAGFLLDDIHEASISTHAAQQLLRQPSMLREPQGVYQLLLHLQSDPDELAETLEKLIELDSEGKITDAVKQLFLQPKVTGPSASVLLELCKHPAIADFVKPRALEKYKNQLQERASQELTLSIPKLIAEMQEAELLENDEALDLKQIMQTK